MVEYDLSLDELRQDDKTVVVETFHIIHDQKTEEEIGSYVKIDYVSSQGLKLINKNQILAYGLRLKNV
jgi:hypothetical protein